MSSVDAEPTTEETTATDELRSGLLAAFEEELGDALVASHVRAGVDLWVRVHPDAWRAAAQFAKSQLEFTFFDFLSAIDWMPSPFGRYEDAEVDTPLADKLGQPYELETGYAGGESRFQMLARVFDVRNRHVGVTLKADVPDDTMTMDSWIRVYAGADWHERETWEMYGITFEGHPGLRHIYLPTEFEGHPLRKDFPLLTRVVKPWPGIVDVEPMPGEPEGEGDEEADAEAAGDDE
ncbi:MAG TPA: NADH-quinone oxidoreductase subunit C [Acidimicrobiales bacterium]|nr:NADH-quinone oxidoreductase subunit C [Acidimicrobiales bacterium]